MANVKTGQLYDMAEVMQTIYAATIKATPPRIAPAQLEPVIKYLEDVTQKCVEHEQRISANFNASPNGRGPQITVLQQIRVELNRWRAKLTVYRTSISQCIATGRGEDNECTLWSVVAPLFFGIYDGPLGTSDPSAPDLRQPFQIANQLSELQTFVNTEWVDAWRYIGEETNRVFANVGEGVTGALRLMATAAGSTVAAAGGGLLAGLGPTGIIGAVLVAAVLFWPKKGGA